jgi:hypothetical protein
MSNIDKRFEQAIARLDAANAQDPSRAKWDGREWPAELLYAMRMTEWLNRLEPRASEALRLAVRAQHLCRWMIPRSQFPMTRAGYHQWRSTLARFHAEKAGEILKSVDYEEPAIARVQSLIRKERLKSDPEAQTLEDVACLVFLEGDYIQFATAHDSQKVIDILRKTWRKMSARGQDAALSLAKDLPEPQRKLIELALGKC